MKKLTLILLLCSSIAAFAQKTNFSGTWLINKAKTDFNAAHAAEWVVPKIIKVEQQADKLTLTRISTDNQLRDQPPVIEILDFDGSPFQRTSSGSQVATTLHWLTDASFGLTRKGTQIATENWTLTDGGNSLVIDRNVETSTGSYAIKCYYNKTN